MRLKVSACCLFEVPTHCAQTLTRRPGDTDKKPRPRRLRETVETQELEAATRIGPGAPETPT